MTRRGEWAARQKIGYLMQQGVDHPDCLSLAAGLVDYSSLPVELVHTVMERILSDPARARAALQYGTTPGSMTFRHQIGEFLAELDETETRPEQIPADRILITTGSQQFLDLVSQAVFDPGDICLVTAPSYFVYLSTLEGIGVEMVAVACDDEGICPDALDERLRQIDEAGQLPRVKMLYLVSYFDNPRGITMTLERRKQVLEVLIRWSDRQFIYLLEDAAYREIWFDDPPPPSILSLDRHKNRVIYTQTFSKSLSPGLRTAFGVLPRDLVKPVTDLKSIHDFGSPHLNQFVIANLIETGEYARHVAEVRRSYRDKAEAMWRGLEDYILPLPETDARRPEGGLYVWLRCTAANCETNFDRKLFQTAVDHQKVMFVPGELFYSDPDDPDASRTMRLSFGVQPIDNLAKGVRRLGEALTEVGGFTESQT